MTNPKKSSVRARADDDAARFTVFREPVAHLRPVEEPPPDHEPPPQSPPDNEPPDPPVQEPPAVDDRLERFRCLCAHLILRQAERFARAIGEATLFIDSSARISSVSADN